MDDDNFRRFAEQLIVGLLPIKSQLGLLPFMSFLAVVSKPGISVNELAETIDVPQATASRYVSVLSGRYQPDATQLPLQLVRQEIHPTDPRKRAVYPTEDGTNLFASLMGKDEE